MNRLLSAALLGAALGCALRAHAADPAPDPHAGHDMSKTTPEAAMPMAMAHDMPMAMAMPMRSPLGDYPANRDASGTAWQPDATTMGGLHLHPDDWNLMLHGFVNGIRDIQRGPRGDTKTFAQSMLMAMADRPLGAGTLGLKAMVSLDPTIGKSGYPLLFQTGETADGSHHLVDRQHPHDLFMELSGSWSLPLGSDSAAYLYAGLPGEPALGPATFMHRFSGMRNPEAPLTHHWLDSTHITFGVVTVGASHGPVKLEGSWFNGREPDQYRWNIETRKFDSWSARLSVAPLPQLSMQVSHGDLKSPEQLEPEVRVRRTTASASLHLKPAGIDWGTTLAWGRNDKSGPEGRRSLPGWLLESTAVIGAKHTVFGRAEQVRNDELFEHDDPLAGPAYRIGKLTLGYIHDFARTGPVAWGLGVSLSAYSKPRELDAAYGRHPTSTMLFLQGRL